MFRFFRRHRPDRQAAHPVPQRPAAASVAGSPTGAATHDPLRAFDAIRRCQAVIEFTPDGRIRDANERMLQTLGYARAELLGHHHAMLVEPEARSSDAYREFWRALAAGTFQSGVFRRLAKGNRLIWLQASYNPILGATGEVTGIIKVAADITARRQRESEVIDRSQAYIEFTPDGTVVDANENFLRRMGYRLDEIRGRHHRMFVEPAYAESPEYAQFWRALAQGTYQQADFRRVTKHGEPVWMRATYSPVLDDAGAVTRVVKVATDVTGELRMRDETNRATGTLLHGLRQLTQTAAGVSHRITANAELARGATEHMQAAATRIGDLDESSRNVGAISDTIREIADKTNLLALNATIEAARAGDAGRGFAVVASEVKDLARQTRDATAQIAQRIHGIQEQVRGAVGAFEAIQQELRGVAGNTAEVATLVQEQGAVIQELDGASRGLSAHSG